MMGFLPNARVGKDLGSCATHMNAVGCHLPFSAVVSLGEHKASGPQAAARSRVGLWIEEVYPQYFSMSYHQKRGRARRGHGGVWPVRVFLASRDLIRVKRLEPGASQ